MGSAPAPKKRVIGMQVKTGVKRKHLDAYAGGEQSGKKARPDALSVEASIKASQLPPSQPSQPGRRPDHFDVNTFDISDASTLGNLRRDELIELCIHYRLRKSGSKPILINALISTSQPRNGVPIYPSATGSSADPTGPSTSSNATQAEAAVSLHPHALPAVPPPHHTHPNPYLYTTMPFYHYPGPRQSQ
ncbi:hypothetical protein BDZ89DRAFT_798406 [Hymenopellis radicata]|nr:hypothetical protein BDZ89DRAFT_798406 [Hymenopellis radicata]